jgi:hypothetical protein
MLRTILRAIENRQEIDIDYRMDSFAARARFVFYKQHIGLRISTIAVVMAALPLANLAWADGALMPRIVTQGGRHAPSVDGKPFLMLGAQVNNSSN